MQQDKPLISIVSPVYKAEKIVDLLVQRISEEVGKITAAYEIILVEDGSPDASWEVVGGQIAR
jgi:dolichol-phosphate mannosyltransferase